MSGLIEKMVVTAALAALTVTSASAACWNPVSVSAAKVRDFEAMLRGASLRCTKDVPELKIAYSNFVTASRPAFAEANKTIRAHFAEDSGLVGSFSAYNGFLTTITNSYGPGTSGLSCADFGDFVNAANAEGASPDVLTRLADMAGASPTLVGQRCSNRVTTAKPVGLQQVAVNK